MILVQPSKNNPAPLLPTVGEVLHLYELTRNDHHAYGENLLVVGLRGDIPETDAGHAGHGEVQCGYVHSFSRWPVY